MLSLFPRNIMRLGSLLGAAGLLLGVTTPTVADTPTIATDPTLYESFDGWNQGGMWKVSQYQGGPGDNEFNPSNVSEDYGELSLVVNANQRVGGEIVSQQDTSYGYYETSMKCSPEPGVVCAFFWVGEHGEIDVELLSNDSSIAHLVFHKPDGSSDYHQYVLPDDFDMSQYHRYGFLYAPESITWTIDGEAVHQISIDNLPDTGQIVLNAWAGHEHWGQGPPVQDATSVFDYVKFYEGATEIV